MLLSLVIMVMQRSGCKKTLPWQESLQIEWATGTFMKSIALPTSITREKSTTFKLKWENHGVAPAYSSYKLKLTLKGTKGTYTQYLTESNNKSWLPGTTTEETYAVNVPRSLLAGKYKVAIALVEEKNNTSRPIELALKGSLKASDNFYEIASIDIK